MQLGLKYLLVLALSAGIAAAEEPAKPKITFDEHVKPIFREHCLSCHNSSKATNDLALDSYARVIQGGASGAAIEPGDPDSSYLWLLVSHESEPAMPPAQDKLVTEKLNLIREWILGGAPENAGSKVAAKPKNQVQMAAGGAAKPEGPSCIPEGLRRQPYKHTARAGAVTALSAAPWAPVLAIGGQKQIVLASTDTGDLLGVVPFDEGIPHVLKFSRSGTLLLAGGGHAAQLGKAVVYDVKTGSRLFDVGDELDVVLGADITADHGRIALGGPQRMLRVYNTSDGALLHEIPKHTDWIYAVEYSPDGILLASADRGGGLFVWEADSMNEYLNLQGHKGGVTDVSWRPDSNVLASASEDGTIKLWEMQNGGNIKSINAHGGGVLAVEFAHDGRMVSAGRDRLVKVWDAAGNQQAQFGPMPEPVLEVAISHDGKRVIAGDWTGVIGVWNIDEKKEERQLSSNPPTLDMLLEQAQAQATAADASAKAAADELTAANSALEAKKQAVAEATASVDSLTQQAEQAKAESPPNQAKIDELTQQVEPARQLAAQRQQEVTAAEAVAAEKAKAAEAAAQAAAAAHAAADTIIAERDALATATPK